MEREKEREREMESETETWSAEMCATEAVASPISRVISYFMMTFNATSFNFSK